MFALTTNIGAGYSAESRQFIIDVPTDQNIRITKITAGAELKYGDRGEKTKRNSWLIWLRYAVGTIRRFRLIALKIMEGIVRANCGSLREKHKRATDEECAISKKNYPSTT